MIEKLIKILVIFTLLLAMVQLGFTLGFVLGERSGFEIAWQTAGQKIKELKIFPDIDAPILGLSGRIIDLKNSYLTLKANPISPNPFESQGPPVRKINFSATTEIIRQISKPSETLLEEQKKFQDQLVNNRDNLENLLPPLPYLQEPAQISDLTIGQTIVVMAGTDIRNQSEFTAKKIIITE